MSRAALDWSDPVPLSPPGARRSTPGSTGARWQGVRSGGRASLQGWTRQRWAPLLRQAGEGAMTQESGSQAWAGVLRQRRRSLIVCPAVCCTETTAAPRAQR
jgi:hypothetical protein